MWIPSKTLRDEHTAWVSTDGDVALLGTSEVKSDGDVTVSAICATEQGTCVVGWGEVTDVSVRGDCVTVLTRTSSVSDCWSLTSLEVSIFVSLALSALISCLAGNPVIVSCTNRTGGGISPLASRSHFQELSSSFL